MPDAFNYVTQRRGVLAAGVNAIDLTVQRAECTHCNGAGLQPVSRECKISLQGMALPASWHCTTAGAVSVNLASVKEQN